MYAEWMQVAGKKNGVLQLMLMLMLMLILIPQKTASIAVTLEKRGLPGDALERSNGGE